MSTETQQQDGAGVTSGTDTLTITWHGTATPTEGEYMIRTVTVAAPVRLLYANGLWRIELPDVSKLADRPRFED